MLKLRNSAPESDPRLHAGWVFGGVAVALVALGMLIAAARGITVNVKAGDVRVFVR